MTEKDFWEAIMQASHTDRTAACLALSDWLEENGQPKKAEWIRDCIKGKGFPVYDPDVALALWFSFDGGESWWSEREGRAKSMTWYDWRKDSHES